MVWAARVILIVFRSSGDCRLCSLDGQFDEERGGLSQEGPNFEQGCCLPQSGRFRRRSRLLLFFLSLVLGSNILQYSYDRIHDGLRGSSSGKFRHESPRVMLYILYKRGLHSSTRL
jgi:hypothetical protein